MLYAQTYWDITNMYLTKSEYFSWLHEICFAITVSFIWLSTAKYMFPDKVFMDMNVFVFMNVFSCSWSLTCSVFHVHECVQCFTYTNVHNSCIQLFFLMSLECVQLFMYTNVHNSCTNYYFNILVRMCSVVHVHKCTQFMYTIIFLVFSLAPFLLLWLYNILYNRFINFSFLVFFISIVLPCIIIL